MTSAHEIDPVDYTAAWALATQCTDFIVAHDPGTVVCGADRGSIWFDLLYHFATDTITMHRDNMGMVDGMLTWGRYDREVTLEDIRKWERMSEWGHHVVILQILSLNTAATLGIVEEGIRKIEGLGDCSLYAVRRGKVKRYPPRFLKRFTTNLN